MNSYKLFIVTTYNYNGVCSVATSIADYDDEKSAEKAYSKLQGVVVTAGKVQVTRLY